MKSKSSVAERYITFLFIVFIILSLEKVSFCIESQPSQESLDSNAVFLTSGGRSYIVLDLSSRDNVRVVEGLFLTEAIRDLKPERKFNGYFKGDSLFIEQEEEDHATLPSSDSNKNNLCLRQLFRVELTPSKTIPGDWDLKEAKYLRYVEGAEYIEDKIEFSWESFKKMDSKDLMKVHRNSIIPHYINYYLWKFNPPDSPLFSFLHRVNDNRVKEYFQRRFMGDRSVKPLRVIKTLAEKYNQDPYIILHQMEMESLVGDVEQASSLWNKWEKTLQEHPDPMLRHNAGKVWKTICMAKFRKDHPNLKDYRDIFESRKADLNERIKWLKSYWDTDQMYYLASPVVDTIPSEHLKFNTLVEFQISAKVLTTFAIFDLFKGKRDEALMLMASLYHLGLSFNSDGSLIQRLISVSGRSAVIKGLTVFALNACETPQELEKCRDILDRFNDISQTIDPKEFLDEEFLFAMNPLIPSDGFSAPNFEEIVTRQRVADVKFQLLRLAVASRYHFLKQVDFPDSLKDISPSFLKDIPEDYFHEANPLKIRKEPKQLTLYSVGPDQDDDQARISYDPTNGTKSEGDIFLVIPREREYPFPIDGVKAANAFQLLTKFPKGLPPDTFAGERSRPLSIIESTEKDPVVVFSFGPDSDEDDYTPYDPGSGFAFSPVPTPDPGLNPPSPHNLQYVMRRSTRFPPPPGHWTLQPMYDPTNGAVSVGDLYIELPR